MPLFPPVSVTAPRTITVAATATGLGQYNTVQAAINAAAASTPSPDATHPYTVYVYPGIYTEVITMAAYVNLRGIGPRGSVIIAQTDATVMTLANPCQIQNITVQLTTPSAARSIIIDNGVACTVYFTMVNFECTTPSNKAITVFNWTAASNITFRDCYCNIGGTSAGNIFSSENVNLTLFMTNCEIIFAKGYIFSCKIGVYTFSGNRFAGAAGLLNPTNAKMSFSNDAILTTGANGSIGGSAAITVKTRPQQYEVYAGMKIQQAITAAAADSPAPSATAPYTVLIHPGIYTEAITCSTYVNLKGIGPKGAVVIQQTDATIITLATQVQIENLTVTLVTPSAARNLIIDNGVACVCTFTDVIVAITTPAARDLINWYLTAASTLTLQRCSYRITGSGSCVGVETATNDNAVITIWNCDFEYTSANPVHVETNTTCTVDIAFTQLKGSVGGATSVYSLGVKTPTINIKDCFISCQPAAFGLYNSSNGIYFVYNSEVQGIVRSSGSGGGIRIKNCSYRIITRSGGYIVDESPILIDSIYHLVSEQFEANVANANYNTRVTGGSVTNGGPGQAVLRVTANGNIAGIEQNAEATGGLVTTFNPTRTPRFCLQFSSDSFPANSSMFFGLRATLGDAVPAMNENHAGFRWNGVNFIASSSNGGGVGVADNCTTPSTGVQHQLEIIIFGGVQVEFYIDGVLVFTHATAAGRPTGELSWQDLLVNAAAQTIDVSLRRFFLQECPQ